MVTKKKKYIFTYCDQKDIIFKKVYDSFKLQENKYKKFYVREQRQNVRYLSRLLIGTCVNPKEFKEKVLIDNCFKIRK